jgi:hypothetical protein
MRFNYLFLKKKMRNSDILHFQDILNQFLSFYWEKTFFKKLRMPEEFLKMILKFKNQ